MTGLYLHIPFCRQACNYCDFHFSTTLNSKAELVNALCKELAQRKTEAQGEISSIYFGGGTPSLLSATELEAIFAVIFANYKVSDGIEITLEANPDDLNKEFLQQLKQTPVNRLSIGIQSFRAEDLLFMNRAHTAAEAIHSVEIAAAAGFNNITIDLIYGIQGLSMVDWEANVRRALSLPVNHISSYCLTVEEGTPLSAKIKKGVYEAVNDEQAAAQFHRLLKLTEDAGMPWYEISNFARPGHESKHNSAYWSGRPYIGIGPSAHSFNGNQRSWNVSNNQKYIKGIREGDLLSETETLTPKQQINEKILTSLRTRKGLTLLDIRNIDATAENEITKSAAPIIQEGRLKLENDTLSLTVGGLLFADGIAAELFV